MAKYSKKAGEKVGKVMEEMKAGKLRSSSGDKVTNPKQAIAIGLSEAREAGARVPKAPATKKESPKKKTAATKQAAPKKAATKKAPVKKAPARKK